MWSRIIESLICYFVIIRDFYGNHYLGSTCMTHIVLTMLPKGGKKTRTYAQKKSMCGSDSIWKWSPLRQIWIRTTHWSSSVPSLLCTVQTFGDDKAMNNANLDFGPLHMGDSSFNLLEVWWAFTILPNLRQVGQKIFLVTGLCIQIWPQMCAGTSHMGPSL